MLKSRKVKKDYGMKKKGRKGEIEIRNVCVCGGGGERLKGERRKWGGMEVEGVGKTEMEEGGGRGRRRRGERRRGEERGKRQYAR